MTTKSAEETIKAFQETVNMKPEELESWLKTRESQAVGQKDGSDESIGHETGRHIVELLHKEPSNYDAEDLSQMRRVISYVRRHSAQQPTGDITETRWRYSLMNWGHDPLKG